MADLDDLLRGCLHERAEDAPQAAGLLGAVHVRSTRLRARRRIVLTAAAVVAVALTVPAVVVGVGGRGGPAPEPAASGSMPSVTSGPTGSATASAVPGTTSAEASSVGPAATGMRLVAPSYPVPSFPLRPGRSAPAFGTPVVTLEGGELRAYFPAKDPEGDADVTLVVSAQRPSFGAEADPVTELSRQVRGHAGVLRTVAVTPTAQLTLYWQEAADSWVQLRTDDTYTPQQVVALADGLVAASLDVVTPLRFDLVPEEMVLDTATASTIALRPAGAPAGGAAGSRAGARARDGVGCTLLSLRPLPSVGTPVSVGGYRGVLNRDQNGASLTVRLEDRRLMLVVRVPEGALISDGDLVRLAAGAHPTEHAEPGSPASS